MGGGPKEQAKWEVQLGSLLDGIRACEGKTVVELAQVLLRACRRGLAELVAILDGMDAPRVISQMSEATREVAMEYDEKRRLEVVFADDVAWLSKILARVSEQMACTVVAARAVAEGLDEAMGHRFAQCFRGRVLDIGEEEVFPVDPDEMTTLFGRSGLVPSNESRSGKKLDALNHLELSPKDMRGIQVRMDWQLEDSFVFLKKKVRLGIGLPNANPLEELQWDRETVEGKKLFFNVRPKDRALQEKRVLDLLEEGEREGLALMVFPELSLDAMGVDAVRGWFRSKAHHLRLVVAGSQHVSLSDNEGLKRRNRCVIFLRGGRETVHFKFNPFSFVDDKDDDGRLVEVRREERINVSPRMLTLQMSGAQARTFLICKDFLHDDTLRLLQDFRVGFVCVAALSPNGLVFEKLSSALTDLRQSCVLVANTVGPSGANEILGLLSRPLRKVPTYVVRRKDACPPVLLSVDLTPSDIC
ncbi:hypothetical protein LXT21_31665 [Myxococcus sp. K38C18041901]|uniref:hypothetical protein n=1 Tax=Myxococcus guangdongensis TaxID=2906760 RepID=UPI0020A811B5|nr:hypothetical protein [Myxococcus guangdongensis]MCP3063347.1 hypothetical protein [Myxococcus guangdongensis]